MGQEAIVLALGTVIASMAGYIVLQWQNQQKRADDRHKEDQETIQRSLAINEKDALLSETALAIAKESLEIQKRTEARLQLYEQRVEQLDGRKVGAGGGGGSGGKGRRDDERS